MAHSHTGNLNLYKPSTGDAASAWTAGLNGNADIIDALRIDQLQAGTDITAGNVSITAHGLCPKLPNDATKFLAGDGTWITAGGTISGGIGTTDHAALSNLDYASAGHTGFAASGHVHAGTDITSSVANADLSADATRLGGILSAGYASTANATTQAAGLLPQLSGNAWTYLNGVGSWVAVSGGGSGDTIAPATNSADYIPQWDGGNSKTLKNGLELVTSIALTGSDSAVPTEQAVREAISAITPDGRTGIEPTGVIADDTVLTVDDLNKCYTIEATTDPVTVTLPAANTGRYGQWLSFTLINGTGGLTIQGPTGVYVGDFNLGDANKLVSSIWTPMQTITIRVVQTDISPGAKWAIVGGTGTWTAEEAS